MKTVNRRRFLIGIAGISVTATLGIIGLGQFHWDKSVMVSRVEKILRYLLRGEEIPDAVIARFSEDYSLRRNSLGSSTAGKVLNALSRLPYPVFRRLLMTAGGRTVEARLQRTESAIVTAFLLSTNYFVRDAASGPVTYLQYYDPYESACQNTLAKFDA